MRRDSFSMLELEDGRVWVAGGETLEPASDGTLTRFTSDTTELWDPRTDVWSKGPQLNAARADHFAVRLLSGLVLIGGGRDAEGDRLPDAELWDARIERAARTKPVAAVREKARALALRDGRAMVIGGDPPNDDAATELLSDRTGEWIATGPVSGLAERVGSVVLQDGRVLVSGGTSRPDFAIDASVHFRPDSVRATRIFDPNAMRWSLGADMLAARREHAMVLLLDGRVLVTGGLRGGEFLASTELWDWRSERWEASGSMRVGLAQHAVCALPDGRVLVSGGSSAEGIRRETEIWDPDTGLFSDGPPMLEPRIGHTALVLRDGRVFVGGGSGRGGPLSTSELLTAL